MHLWIVRVLFILAFALVTFLSGQSLSAALWAAGFASVLVGLEFLLKRALFRDILACLVGMSIGLAVAILVNHSISIIAPMVSLPLQVGILAAFTYFGMMSVYRRRDDFPILMLSGPAQAKKQSFKILDTSVLIDGRIADICQTGFLEGTIIIPRFVLKELQYIADSTDALRRNKGRRGFKVLSVLQENPDLLVEIDEDDYPDIREVDAKLVEIARDLGAKIITNDFNLHKVAEIQGVAVLNINELANAVKPVVLPGEPMTVRVIKEGKEYNQGVGYLDDGTMVIVENGRQCVGQTLQVVVTSVLQTNAGRMIFSRRKTDEVADSESNDQRRSSRGWQRK